jgi:diphthine-ammonia ligase
MKTAVLFSGGKDSCLALFKASENYKVDYLLSIIPETSDSWMFHTPDLKLLNRQAEELGKKLIIEKTKGEKEKELADLERLIKKSGVEKLIVGGIASNYQLERIKKICDKFRIELIAPLLGYSTERLWKELFEAGFKVILTKIATEGIDKSFLGKVIDARMLTELEKRSKEYGFRMDFEGGDAESAVLFMPGMKKEIKLKTKIRSEGNYRHFLEIVDVK